MLHFSDKRCAFCVMGRAFGTTINGSTFGTTINGSASGTVINTITYVHTSGARLLSRVLL